MHTGHWRSIRSTRSEEKGVSTGWPNNLLGSSTFVSSGGPPLGIYLGKHNQGCQLPRRWLGSVTRSARHGSNIRASSLDFDGFLSLKDFTPKRIRVQEAELALQDARCDGIGRTRVKDLTRQRPREFDLPADRQVPDVGLHMLVEMRSVADNPWPEFFFRGFKACHPTSLLDSASQ